MTVGICPHCGAQRHLGVDPCPHLLAAWSSPVAEAVRLSERVELAGLPGVEGALEDLFAAICGQPAGARVYGVAATSGLEMTPEEAASLRAHLFSDEAPRWYLTLASRVSAGHLQAAAVQAIVLPLVERVDGVTVTTRPTQAGQRTEVWAAHRLLATAEIQNALAAFEASVREASERLRASGWGGPKSAAWDRARRFATFRETLTRLIPAAPGSFVVFGRTGFAEDYVQVVATGESLFLEVNSQQWGDGSAAARPNAGWLAAHGFVGGGAGRNFTRGGCPLDPDTVAECLEDVFREGLGLGADFQLSLCACELREARVHLPLGRIEVKSVTFPWPGQPLGAGYGTDDSGEPVAFAGSETQMRRLQARLDRGELVYLDPADVAPAGNLLRSSA